MGIATGKKADKEILRHWESNFGLSNPAYSQKIKRAKVQYSHRIYETPQKVRAGFPYMSRPAGFARTF